LIVAQAWLIVLVNELRNASKWQQADPPGRRLSLRQVTDFQQIVHDAASGLHRDFLGTTDKEERARAGSAISNLAKGWVSLQDAKREILGKPKAGVRKHAIERSMKTRVGTPPFGRCTEEP
jgi:hypothetical protein